MSAPLAIEPPAYAPKRSRYKSSRVIRGVELRVPVVIAAGPAPRAHRDAIVIDVPRRLIKRRGRSVEMRGVTCFWFVASLLVRPGISSLAEMTDIIWGADPDGGPVSPSWSVHKVKSEMAERLYSVGLVVQSWYGVGFEMRDAW